MIYPPAKRASKLGEVLPSLADVVNNEHKRLLARKTLIEKNKEEQERRLFEQVYISQIKWSLIPYPK